MYPRSSNGDIELYSKFSLHVRGVYVYYYVVLFLRRNIAVVGRVFSALHSSVIYHDDRGVGIAYSVQKTSRFANEMLLIVLLIHFRT